MCAGVAKVQYLQYYLLKVIVVDTTHNKVCDSQLLKKAGTAQC